MCVLYLAVAIGVGPGVTLFGMGRARTSFTLNLVKAPLLLLALPLGIWQFGAIGAAWGLALTETVMLPLLIIAAVRAMRGRPGKVGSADAVPGSASASPVTESVTVSSTLFREDRPDAVS
jgi:Na+-driven multidrug efflux pump